MTGSSRNILAAMFAVAVAFAAVIGFGFWIHDRPNAISISDNVFGVVAGFAIVAIALFIFSSLTGISFKPSWRWSWKQPAAHQVIHGDYRSAAKIAYDADPSRVATCIHLQPVERAMRAAGVKAELYDYWASWPVVDMACCVNEAELKRIFALPAAVRYLQQYEQDRSDLIPRADIFCDACLKLDPKPCTIRVMHPDDARAGTRWFPSAPPTPPPPAP